MPGEHHADRVSASASHSFGSKPNRLSAPAVRSAVYSLNDSALKSRFDDRGRILREARLVAEVVGAHDDLVERRFIARSLVVSHLQFVELEHQIVGLRHGLEAVALANQKHARDVDALDQFLGGRR